VKTTLALEFEDVARGRYNSFVKDPAVDTLREKARYGIVGRKGRGFEFHI